VAFFEFFNTGFVDIHAYNAVTGFSQPRAADQAYVTAANNRDFHSVGFHFSSFRE
jgi:hypothetical protein